MTVYRTGRHLGRTVYRVVGDGASDRDELIGVMDTPELDRMVVDALNRTTDTDRNARAYGWEVGRGQPPNAVIHSTEGNPFLDPDRRGDLGGTPSHVPPPARLRLADPPACTRVGTHNCQVVGAWRNHDHMDDLP